MHAWMHTRARAFLFYTFFDKITGKLCESWSCTGVQHRSGAKCDGVSKSFRTGRLEPELQMVQLSASRWSRITISWVSLVSFAGITLCVASRVFVVISLLTQSGNCWIHPRTYIWKHSGAVRSRQTFMAHTVLQGAFIWPESSRNLLELSWGTTTITKSCT
jgi:hypothetical protein